VSAPKPGNTYHYFSYGGDGSSIDGVLSSHRGRVHVLLRSHRPHRQWRHGQPRLFGVRPQPGRPAAELLGASAPPPPGRDG
jgi:hypothetical protein